MVNNINSQFQKLSQLQEAQQRSRNLQKTDRGTPSFKQVLDQQQVAGKEQDIKFSSHAEKRIHSRNIDMNPEVMSRLQNALGKAKEKGANETLMVFENFSLVVSVKNSTVITAVDRAGMQENVFTNIDSAVIA
ncbi:MAG: TIGR02530 family flagellar biosynthesis protein [Candidatus Goldiibacteriota bacterium]